MLLLSLDSDRQRNASLGLPSGTPDPSNGSGWVLDNDGTYVSLYVVYTSTWTLQPNEWQPTGTEYYHVFGTVADDWYQDATAFGPIQPEGGLLTPNLDLGSHFRPFDLPQWSTIDVTSYGLPDLSGRHTEHNERKKSLAQLFRIPVDQVPDFSPENDDGLEGLWSDLQIEQVDPIELVRSVRDE